MAITRTFAQLSLAVQQAGQWENSADITGTVLLQAINYGLIRGYDEMVKKWADYYTLDATFAIVAGTSSYVLSTVAPNFYKLRHLDVSQNGTSFRRCFPHDLEVAYRYTTNTATSVSRLRYRMQGQNLVFVPVPPTATARIFWIPLPVQFASIADVTPVTFDVPAEEELVVHLAQRACLDRSDLDVSGINRQIAEDIAGLRSSSDSRDAGEPFSLDPNGPPGRWGYGDEDDGYY
jgi:head-tail adaptor